MIELRWLTTSWEEFHDTMYKTKTSRVLQYRCKLITPTSDDAGWSDWKEVKEEFING